MDTEALKEKVSAAKEKVEKCKNTIVRHRTQLDKRLIKARELGCIINSDGDFAQLENYWTIYDRSAFTNEQVWAIFDINTKIDDIKGAFNKLKDAERILHNWEQKLANELERENIIEKNCPSIIKEFLEQWKINNTEYFQNKFRKWPEFVQSLKNAVKIAKIECLQGVAEVGAEQFVIDNELEDILWRRTSIFKPAIDEETKKARLAKFTEAYREYHNKYSKNGDEFYLNHIYPDSLVEAYLKSCDLDRKGINEKRRNFGGDLLLKMVEQGGEDKAFAFLEKALEAEKKAKIIDLISRVESIAGTILDATNLHIGKKGDLEGIIIGEHGAAKINTIGAGGYNIQCYHFRTLIHEYKEKNLDDLLRQAGHKADAHNNNLSFSKSNENKLME